MSAYRLRWVGLGMPFRLKNYRCTCVWEIIAARTTGHGFENFTCRRIATEKHGPGGICDAILRGVHFSGEELVIVDDLAVALEQTFT